MKLPSLTIFFPFFNDEKTVEPLLSEAYAIGQKWSCALEVIALHGGPSSDRTFEEILKAKKRFPDLIVLDKRDNQEGYAVIRHGLMAASKEWIFYTDGDGQYSLSDLPSLIAAAWETHASVINGYKIRRADPWYRRFFGLGYRWFCKVLFSLPIRDIDCDFRLIKKEALAHLEIEAKGASFLTELILKLHLKNTPFREVPVIHLPRRYGSSNYSTWGLFKEKFMGDLALFASMRKVDQTLWWYQGLRNVIYHAIAPIAQQPKTLCDLGCGTGANLEMLQKAFPHFSFHGIDLSPTAVDLCQKKGLPVKQGSSTNLPWKDRSADIVLIADLFCMLTPIEQAKTLQEAQRVLKPDGLLILHEPAYLALRSQHDTACNMIDRFTKKRLRALLSPYFTCRFSTYRVTALFPLLLLVKMYKKWTFNPQRPPKSDLSIPLFNRLFSAIQLIENRLAHHSIPLPFGSSLFFLAHPRKAAASLVEKRG